jgi:hypothetical protein
MDATRRVLKNEACRQGIPELGAPLGFAGQFRFPRTLRAITRRPHPSYSWKLVGRARTTSSRCCGCQSDVRAWTAAFREVGKVPQSRLVC